VDCSDRLQQRHQHFAHASGWCGLNIFPLAVQWKSGQSDLDLLCNHFVFADVVLDSILMYVDLLIGFYKYCLGETVELGCDSIFIRQ
jgi:hypothetical protein